MSVAKTRAEFSAALREIAWEQWSRMGVAVASRTASWTRAADPEALLVFTLEVGRDEPRLVDEALDWFLLNESLLSIHRLRGLSATAEDRSLIDAAIAWMASHKKRGGSSVIAPVGYTGTSTAYFRDAGSTVPGHEDPAFAAHGFSRSVLNPSHKSQRADLAQGINFALRLRRLLGVGVRAEVIRALLTINAPRLETAVIARSTGFAERNVREVLGQLVDARFVSWVSVGDSRTFWIGREAWTELLSVSGNDRLPRHYDWIAALRALTVMLRWISQPRTAELSEYMLASSARDMTEAVLPDLRYAGIRTVGGFAPGPIDWEDIHDFMLTSAAQVLRGGP